MTTCSEFLIILLVLVINHWGDICETENIKAGTDDEQIIISLKLGMLPAHEPSDGFVDESLQAVNIVM